MSNIKLLSVLALLAAFTTTSVIQADDEADSVEMIESTAGSTDKNDAEEESDESISGVEENSDIKEEGEATKPTTESIKSEYTAAKKELIKVFAEQLVKQGYAENLEEGIHMLKKKKDA